MSPTAEAAMTETRIAVAESGVQATLPAPGPVDLAPSATRARTREEIRLRIEEIGIVPSIRTSSTEDALFAATAIARAGIPIVEVNVNFPGAMGVVSHLAKHAPDVLVGAGSVLNANAACRCRAEGAKFLSCDGLLPEVVDFAAKQNVLIISGALTPTEVIAAWNSGSDFVKVFPCDAVGGHQYIRSLKGALPDARLIAAGGVTPLTALDFILAGSSALGIDKQTFPHEAIWLRQSGRIQELARRFRTLVDKGRA
jgi:2-dehydro-3-deoxyphosphogluconate aldolase / (4S)-4-hydroxy-2-oxoglutarate aldolase